VAAQGAGQQPHHGVRDRQGGDLAAAVAVTGALALLNPNGTFDFGNLQSPPDSGFMVEQFFRVLKLLIQDGSSETVEFREHLKEVMLNAAEALVTGGVHTPNHRWVICAALAGVHSIYPDQRYVDRIDKWLS
jgi:hypothetical protein